MTAVRTPPARTGRPRPRPAARPQSAARPRTTARKRPTARTRPSVAPALRAVPEPTPTRHRWRAVLRLPVAGLAVVGLLVLIGAAVAFQAQQVAGQHRLDDLDTELQRAAVVQAELRAAVAGAESPAKVLEAAEADGMVQPAAVAVVPAPVPDGLAATPGEGPLG